MVVSKKFRQDIQCNLETCPMSRIFSSPSPPLCLDQERGRKGNIQVRKLSRIASRISILIRNAYKRISVMIFRRLQGIQLMLAESRLHRNFANTFNMALILTI